MTLPQQLTPGTWTLDMSHSEIGFSVRHAGISKVRGRFTDAQAEARVGESLAESTVHATVATASFDSGDANRDAHVRGEDFCFERDVRTFLQGEEGLAPQFDGWHGRTSGCSIRSISTG